MVSDAAEIFHCQVPGTAGEDKLWAIEPGIDKWTWYKAEVPGYPMQEACPNWHSGFHPGKK
jgi:hypothetical protein